MKATKHTHSICHGQILYWSTALFTDASVCEGAYFELKWDKVMHIKIHIHKDTCRKEHIDTYTHACAYPRTCMQIDTRVILTKLSSQAAFVHVNAPLWLSVVQTATRQYDGTSLSVLCKNIQRGKQANRKRRKPPHRKTIVRINKINETGYR